LSDQEQDWIAKYRAALDSERGQKSFAAIIMAVFRRIGRSIGAGAASGAVEQHETANPVRKPASHDVSPAQEERDTKAS